MNLAAEMSRLPEPKTDNRPPDWEYWRLDLWRHAQNDSPYNFTKWPPIYHCMLVDHWRYIVESAEMPFVNPVVPAILADCPNLSDGLNRIHQAYHILRWQEATGLSIADMQSIYEFGGGYGAMALVCNRLGFKGTYYIYDLPEFALLQQWYLLQTGAKDVVWFDKLPDEFKPVDLFIACYSLSETDYQQRIEHMMTYRAKSFLLLYSNKFEQFDNIEFFQNSDMAQYLSVSNWQHSRIEHLPPESWYTWGW